MNLKISALMVRDILRRGKIKNGEFEIKEKGLGQIDHYHQYLRIRQGHNSIFSIQYSKK